MSMLQLHDRDGYHRFDEAECRAAGRALATRYQSADPFPHVVIEGLVDADILRGVVRDFPDGSGVTASDRAQERLKRQYHPAACSGRVTHDLFAALNSQAFLGFLTEMTGMPGLIADPYFLGAGLHETARGGHLGIHADFNWHETMWVERRLNLLIYLNDEWDDSFGGALELWDREMKGCRVRVAPQMARAVVFTTDLDSFHGHPDPVQCPPDRPRRSIATYYYQATAPTAPRVERTTNFRVRPNTGDKHDWKIMAHHFANDWCPPALRRRLPI